MVVETARRRVCCFALPNWVRNSVPGMVAAPDGKSIGDKPRGDRTGHTRAEALKQLAPRSVDSAAAAVFGLPFVSLVQTLVYRGEACSEVPVTRRSVWAILHRYLRSVWQDWALQHEYDQHKG